MSTPTQQKPVGAQARPGERRKPSETARTGALVALAILLTLFAVFNLGKVEVNWIVGSGHAPLIVVIVVSVLFGIVITYGAERLVRRRRR